MNYSVSFGVSGSTVNQLKASIRFNPHVKCRQEMDENNTLIIASAVCGVKILFALVGKHQSFNII